MICKCPKQNASLKASVAILACVVSLALSIKPMRAMEPAHNPGEKLSVDVIQHIAQFCDPKTYRALKSTCRAIRSRLTNPIEKLLAITSNNIIQFCNLRTSLALRATCRQVRGHMVQLHEPYLSFIQQLSNETQETINYTINASIANKKSNLLIQGNSDGHNLAMAKYVSFKTGCPLLRIDGSSYAQTYSDRKKIIKQAIEDAIQDKLNKHTISRLIVFIKNIDRLPKNCLDYLKVCPKIVTIGTEKVTSSFGSSELDDFCDEEISYSSIEDLYPNLDEQEDEID